MKQISPYRDTRAFVITADNGGLITKKDFKELDGHDLWYSRGNRFHVLHFSAGYRDEVVRKLKSVRLSKKMTAVEITDAQFGMRFKLPETIAGTGFHATEKQLAEAIAIG